MKLLKIHSSIHICPVNFFCWAWSFSYLCFLKPLFFQRFCTIQCWKVLSSTYFQKFEQYFIIVAGQSVKHQLVVSLRLPLNLFQILDWFDVSGKCKISKCSNLGHPEIVLPAKETPKEIHECIMQILGEKCAILIINSE